MSLGLALDHEEPEDVRADLAEQLVDRDVGGAALGLLHLLAAARERHELVHHQLELFHRTAERADRGAHEGELLDVIGALHVDDAVEAPAELLAVIGDVRATGRWAPRCS